MLIDDQEQNKEISNCEDEGSSQGLRLQLLHLAKDVLQHKAAMKWETHKMCEDVTVDNLIEETRKLYNFVTES